MNNLHIELKKNLYYLGVNDRDTPRFENLWPLEYGVAYNSYLILDKYTCLVDTVRINKAEGFTGSFSDLIGNRNLDYMILQHVEPDHAGAVSMIMEKYPDVTVVGNKQTKRLLKTFYDIEPKKFLEVKEGDVLDLGERKLKFFLTSMVHWPESMVCFEENEGILFSQDIFGSFGTVDGSVFDDEMEYKRIKSEIRRYYSNIIGHHNKQTARILDKLSKLDIKMICPVHGIVWRTYIDTIVDAYTSWAKMKLEKGVVLVYGSMYGMTEAICDIFARFLVENGVTTVKIFDASKTHPSYIINQIFKYNGLVVASTTYNQHVLPCLSGMLNILRDYTFDNHIYGHFAEYGWSSTTNKELKEFGENIKAKIIESDINIHGKLREEDMEKLKKLAKDMAKAIGV